MTSEELDNWYNENISEFDNDQLNVINKLVECYKGEIKPPTTIQSVIRSEYIDNDQVNCGEQIAMNRFVESLDKLEKPGDVCIYTNNSDDFVSINIDSYNNNRCFAICTFNIFGEFKLCYNIDPEYILPVNEHGRIIIAE